MPGRNQPVAFFDMNAISGVPLNRVHNMLSDVERRMGRTRAGHIEVCPDAIKNSPEGLSLVG